MAAAPPSTDATLIPLDQVDPDLVEQVLDEAFGPDRHARTAYRVRTGTDYLPGLSFAAVDEDEMLAGTIQAWPVALTDPEGRAHPMIMVGPVAVLPQRQDQGFGRAMMWAQIAALGSSPLPQVLIGDPDYYGPFGYSNGDTGEWLLPGPFEAHRLLVRCANPAVLPRAGMLGPWAG